MPLTAPGLDGIDGSALEVDAADPAQVELGQGSSTYRFDHRVIPHAPTVEEPGRDEERGCQPMLQQDRQRDPVVVGVAIIERDR